MAKPRLGALFVLVVCLVPQGRALSAQQPDQPVRGAKGLAALYDEWTVVHERLQDVLARALSEHPELLERNRELEARRAEALQSSDPETSSRWNRLAELNEGYARAIQEDDDQLGHELLLEGVEALAALQAAAEAAVRRQQLDQPIEASRAEILSLMIEIEPRVVELLAREAVLADSLATIFAGSGAR